MMSLPPIIVHVQWENQPIPPPPPPPPPKLPGLTANGEIMVKPGTPLPVKGYKNFYGKQTLFVSDDREVLCPTFRT
jgi:hypothetical protein